GTRSLSPKCRVFEILQYTCPPGEDEQGRPRFNCYPVPRIFRICEGRGAVEITRVVNLDTGSGEVDIPNDAENRLPRAKAWTDV
ncbi:hypothetical protein K488DRAFT_36265, partial [Vararia minispora EC-137]